MSPPARRSRPTSGDDTGGIPLTGGGPSQLGVGGSMRARDVSRPTGDDLAEAERLVQVSYRPRTRPRDDWPPEDQGARKTGRRGD